MSKKTLHRPAAILFSNRNKCTKKDDASSRCLYSGRCFCERIDARSEGDGKGQGHHCERVSAIV